jgi:hypothetical protein
MKLGRWAPATGPLVWRWLRGCAFRRRFIPSRSAVAPTGHRRGAEIEHEEPQSVASAFVQPRGGGSREADMAGGGASGGSVVLTNRHHAGMDKNEHSGVRNERIISMCRRPAKTITSSAPSTASRLVRTKGIFVSNGMMKQGHVGVRVGFDGIRDLKSGQILPLRPCVS